MQNQNTSQSQTRNIIFYDGVCLLCNHFVLFVLNRDNSNKLFFAPLQGSTAKQLLTGQQISDLNTVYLYQNESLYNQSDAIIRILIALNGLYQLLRIFLILPKPIRDFAYQIVAKNRYQIFGQKDYCPINHPKKNQILP